MAERRTLNVNGRSRTITVDDPDMPLLLALRENLSLNGPLFGCGLAQCGACTVHVDGAAVRSCSVPLSAAAGKRVTTVEGLSPNRMHALQRAWIELDVPQCGYCQTGQIMSAAVLLAENPSPTDRDVDLGMAGNVCRCATYVRIRAAIHRAAAELGGGPR